MGDTMPPNKPVGTARDEHAEEGNFLARHATGVTLVAFLVSCAGLGLAPGIPSSWRPVDLTSRAQVTAMAERVLRRPKMTFTIPGAQNAPADDDGVGAEDDGPTRTAALMKVVPSKDDTPKAAVGDARRGMQVTAKVTRLRKEARRLKAKGAEVENPCIAPGVQGCSETALDSYFAALDDAAAGVAGAKATVLTLGNSLIASDHVTDVVRDRLAENFGDGGRGFLLLDRLSKVAGRRVRTGRSSGQWTIHTFAQKPPKRSHFGFTGSSHESGKRGDKSTWSLRGSTRGVIYWQDHKSASGFTLYADAQEILKVSAERSAEPADKTMEFDLPEGAKSLKLVADGKGVVIYGVSLENDEPGTVWDTIGVPASDSEMYVEKSDPGVFQRQLKARDPNLAIVMVGGNEIRSLAFGWTTLEEVRKYYSTLFDRVQEALPDASCMAVAPIDAAKATAAGATLTTRPEVAKVVALEREVALEKGCAFFNLWGAMGATGSLQRFHRAGYVNDDLVHPKGKGGDILGQLIADGLFATYEKTPKPQIKRSEPKRRLVYPRLAGLTFPGKGRTLPIDAHPLLPVVNAVTAVTSRQPANAQLRIGQYGGDSTADQVMTDRLRKRFIERLGSAGRGLIGVGDDDKRLLGGRVKRRLRGDFQVTDGRGVDMGGAMGLFGQTTRLSKSGRFDVEFCAGCKVPPVRRRGFIDVAWLYTPGMGRAEVLVNDVVVGELSAARRSRRNSDVQFLRIPVRGEQHRLSVVHRSAEEANGVSTGPVHLLSVAQEIDARGVVLDAVGIASSTGMTMQRWQPDVVIDQAARRHHDLLLVAWGDAEETLHNLDRPTYTHHFRRTIQSLKKANPNAACILIGPMPQRADEPTGGMVPEVQAELAEELNCGHFSVRTALSRVEKPVDGAALFGPTGLSPAGFSLVADALYHDVMTFTEYAQAKRKNDAAVQTGSDIAVAPTDTPPSHQDAPENNGAPANDAPANDAPKQTATPENAPAPSSPPVQAPRPGTTVPPAPVTPPAPASGAASAPPAADAKGVR